MQMERVLKAAQVEKAAAPEADELALINRQALRELAAEDVFTFRLAACDNQEDREYERFSDEALEQMAALFVGRPVLMDHKWSAAAQTARVYDAAVETQGEYKRLALRCYMLRTAGSAETIAALEGGVLRECSVGLSVSSAVCSVCGANQMEKLCRHSPGLEYNGVKCIFTLGDVRDVYEVSLCAVPAQPRAGAVKAKRYGGAEPSGDGAPPRAGALRLRLRMAEARARTNASGPVETGGRE